MITYDNLQLLNSLVEGTVKLFYGTTTELNNFKDNLVVLLLNLSLSRYQPICLRTNVGVLDCDKLLKFFLKN